MRKSKGKKRTGIRRKKVGKGILCRFKMPAIVILLLVAAAWVLMLRPAAERQLVEIRQDAGEEAVQKAALGIPLERAVTLESKGMAEIKPLISEVPVAEEVRPPVAESKRPPVVVESELLLVGDRKVSGISMEGPLAIGADFVNPQD